MLILVGVTISVALNGGLFKTAQDAATNTIIEAEKEQLLSAIVAAIGDNAKVNFTKLDNNLPNRWSKVADKTYQSPKGNKYTVKEDGTIEFAEKEEKGEDVSADIPDELARYILGAELGGRDFGEIIDISTYTFKEDPAKTNEKIKPAYIEDEFLTWEIRYNRDVYQFKINGETGRTEKESLKKIGTPQRGEGKYVKYKGIDWIVLYDDEEKVELISAEALGKVTLGGNSFESARTSYNNVVTTLTEACKAETGITAGIRNAGGQAEDATTVNVTLKDLKEKGFEPETSSEATIAESIEDLKQGDENYLEDYDQMKKLGILIPDILKDYWLTSRLVYVEAKFVSFRTRVLWATGGGNAFISDLFNVTYNGSESADEKSYAVRPVVTLNAGILEGKTEEGTRQNPINLD